MTQEIVIYYAQRVYREFAKHNVCHEIINILNTFAVDIASKIHTHSLSGYVTYIKTYFIKSCLILVIFSTVIFRPLGYERVYLPLCKVADTPFHIQGDDLSSIMCSLCVVLCPTSFSSTLGYVRVYLRSTNLADGPFHVRR